MAFDYCPNGKRMRLREVLKISKLESVDTAKLILHLAHKLAQKAVILPH